MQTGTHLCYYLVEFFLKWEIFKKNFVENIKTQILCLKYFFWKSWCLLDKTGKHGTAKQVTHDGVMRFRKYALCMLANYDKSTDIHHSI